MVACIATPRFSLRCISALSIHTPQSILQSSRQQHGVPQTPKSNLQSPRHDVCNGNNSFNTKRNFSDHSSYQEEFEGLVARRNKNIIMHPEVCFDFESPQFCLWHFDYTPYTSIFFSGICIVYFQGLGQKILPGNYVVKKHPKTGVYKKIFLEHALGYFWAFKVGMLLLIFILFIFVCTCISSSAVDHHICRSYHLLTENQYYQMKQSYQLPRLRSSLHWEILLIYMAKR